MAQPLQALNGQYAWITDNLKEKGKQVVSAAAGVTAGSVTTFACGAMSTVAILGFHLMVTGGKPSSSQIKAVADRVVTTLVATVLYSLSVKTGWDVGKEVRNNVYHLMN